MSVIGKISKHRSSLMYKVKLVNSNASIEETICTRDITLRAIIISQKNEIFITGNLKRYLNFVPYHILVIPSLRNLQSFNNNFI